MTESPIDVLGRPESTQRSGADRVEEARRRLDAGQSAQASRRGLFAQVRALLFGR